MLGTRVKQSATLLKTRLYKRKTLLTTALVLLLLTLWLITKPQSSLLTLQSQQHERYLAYLPHSGLSNQRIELANALVLAALLNRTLIVPPALLGNVVGWMSRKDLADHLSWLTTPKDFQSICQPPTPGLWRSYVRRSRCEEYTHFGAMAWTDLHDFTSLAPHVRIQHHTIVSLPALQRTLGLTDKDTWVHSDRQLYDWRLYQDPKEAKAVMSNGSNYVDSFTGRHYYKVMDLDPWQQRPERLLQLGGVFGSTRLVLRHPEHLALQRTIALALHYRRDTPLGTTVQAIVDHLGGVGTFLSLHFRTGDAPFRSQLGGNLETMIRTMAAMTGAPVMLPADTAPKDKNTATDRSLSFWRLSAIQSQPRFHLTPPRDLTSLPWADFCSGVPANRSIAMDSINARALVYIATDYENPRGNESRLLPWYDHFPCTVTLQDIPVSLLDGLDQVKDVVDPTKSLRSFLLPLVDAMVAAHAREILTTPRSTYSRYIAFIEPGMGATGSRVTFISDV